MRKCGKIFVNKNVFIPRPETGILIDRLKKNGKVSTLLDVGTDDWVSAELKPVSSINNVYSFQLIFGGTAPADFEINDISIIYRMKSIK